MKTVGKSICLLLSAILLSAVLTGCDSLGKKSNGITVFTSYRDIPGVTEEEIAAIEALHEQGGSFTYGMLPNTETFLDANGEIRGYSALLCNWLTNLFGITFTPKHYTWAGLLEGLASGEVDFTGDLTANDERRKTYIMTDAMAQRSIKYFRIAGTPLPAEIAKTRLPRYALQVGTTITEDVKFYAEGRFEPIYIMEYDEAYELLKAGKVDVIITENVQEAFFDHYGDIAISDFFPLIYSPVSFSTQNPKLAPFISVVQKALENRSARYLNELYDKGYQEYLRRKLSLRLTANELEYINNNPVIPFAAEYDNYPISFFSVHYNEWQGICFDVLKDIEILTGLKFSVVNNKEAEFHDLVEKLENGDAYILSELIMTADRQNRFIWPSNSFMTERSVLISRVDHRNVNINRIYSENVGLSKGTAHSEFFYKWFPNHPNTTIFESQAAAFDALLKGDVDMVMNSYSTLLYLTNYQELADFKANIIFDNSFESTFGLNKDQQILRSIIDKALELVDTRTISEQWRHKTYDYRIKVAQAQRPWLIGSIVLSLCVLALVVILFANSRQEGKVLEELVEKRTQELALQTTTLTTLFNSIPDLIFTKNADLHFMHCNKAFLEHFGKRMEDLIGKSDADGLGVSDEMAMHYNEKDREVMREGRIVAFEEHIPSINGTNPLYETTKIPLMLDGTVIGVMGIAHDITVRKEMAEAALAASRSKSSFLANMSHEIRTPMNAILGVTEILIHDEALPKNVEEGLGKIYTSCNLLLGIIDDILDFSKIEAGKLDIMPAEYKVASLINDTVHLNMMRIESKPIEFELQIDENIPAKLIGDELRIKQILNNLLSNAFKYTDSGKVTLTVSAKSAPEKEEGTVLWFSVKDTGHGMTKDQLERMFEEYSRFNKMANRTIGGTGLGLAITQRLINLMCGEIHAESKLHKGTLFSVGLPQGMVDDEVLGAEIAANLRQFRTNYISQQKSGPKIVRDPMPYGSVLIVDDVETNLYVAVGLMKLYRLQIDTAMSGREALAKIKNGKTYDIVFMDHMMPEMDGIMTTKYLRKLGYTEPIVALTANAVAGQADIFLQNGFDDFISKPIDIRQLNSILNKLVRDKQTPEAIEAARQQKGGAAETNGNGDNGEMDSLLVESFIRDAGKTVAVMDELYQKPSFESDDEDIQKYIIVVHGIKSSLRNIGEIALSETAYKLEMAGRERNTGLITSITAEFLDKLRALLENFEQKRDEKAADEDGAIDDIDNLRDKLLAIGNACADYNRKGALDILADMKSRSKETKATLDNIMANLLQSNFDEAERIAVACAAELTQAAGLIEEKENEKELAPKTQNSAGGRFRNKKIAGLNIDKGLERYDDNEEIYLRVLRSYSAAVRTILAAMNTFNEDKPDTYERAAHSIKGASAGIFAEQISKEAGMLEKAAIDRDFNYINKHNSAFLETIRKFSADLDDMILIIDTENPKPKKERPDTELLAKLKAACSAYNMDGADAAMEEIERYQYTADNGLANWLRESMDKMNFAQIVKKLSDSNG